MIEDQSDNNFGKKPWFERHEKAIICLSGLATAIGVLFAAASSFFAWQQLEMISRERMTPYRAILYSAKVDKMADFIAATTAYERLSSNLGGISTFSFDGKIGPELLKYLQDLNRQALSQHDTLQNAVEVNRAVWPHAISEDLKQILIPADTLNFCSKMFDDYKNSIPKSENKPIKDACSPAIINPALEQYEKLRIKITAEMGADLRTDQLQTEAEKP